MSAAFEYDKKYGVTLPSVVITSLLTCNFQCYGCTNGSNLGIDDSSTLEEKISWIENLAKVLKRCDVHLKSVDVLGGEPLINENALTSIRRIDQILPNTQICMYTNGVLLHKREHIIAGLAEFREKFKMYITIHTNDENYFKTITKGIYILQKYRIHFEVVGGHFPVLNENPPDFWQVIRPIDEDGKMHPANEPNYKKSWAICADKYCPQLYNNALWKCSQLAFLEQTLKVTKQENDEEWQPYLKYKPLLLDDNCTLENLVDFFTAGPEKVCSLCPSEIPIYAEKSIKRKDYKNFDLSKPTRILGRNNNIT